jgi:hypothetical protein
MPTLDVCTTCQTDDKAMEWARKEQRRVSQPKVHGLRLSWPFALAFAVGIGRVHQAGIGVWGSRFQIANLSSVKLLSPSLGRRKSQSFSAGSFAQEAS